VEWCVCAPKPAGAVSRREAVLKCVVYPFAAWNAAVMITPCRLWSSTSKAPHPRKLPWARELALFYADESGAHLVEWTVLTVIIILSTYLVMVQLRAQVAKMFRSLILRQFSAPGP